VDASPRKAREVFLAAVKLPAAERQAYLQQACGDDQALYQRIAALLEAQAEIGSFQEAPAPTVDQSPGETVGAVIGPYKLLEPIGEGGMGTVWMAQQTEPVKRLVALKLIKAGMDSKQVIARFEAERQALALMDHPNIARVLDADATSTGRPYFVMDLVKGVPLTRYCDEHRLTPRERLELFVPVCQAIQHAHQKGIIHRDIKPSNVLVALYDGKPVPKVIDFGVAKATGQQLTEHTVVTGFGAVVGTLEYMSPEQAELNQLDIDTRSDIYSLGVLLYELLTGTTPLERKRLKETGLLEALRLIREEEAPTPSTRLSTTDELPTVAANRGMEPRKLSGLVRGELDWLVMKALDKDRNRRYESANSLALDMQRYLADEPVFACPPSAWYRLSKFGRRNRGRLAVTALVLCFLASLGGVAVWAAMDRADRVREAEVEQAAQRAALAADIGRDLDEAQAFCREDRLRETSAVVEHAEALVGRGGADDELGRRVRQMRADVDMGARLEAIRLERADVRDEHFDVAGAAARYAEAFSAYGLDMGQLDPDKAAARIAVSAIRKQLIAALDDWLLAQSGALRERLQATLEKADGDPWRKQLRAAFVDGNAKALRELAQQPNAGVQPPAAAVLMGHALREVDEIELAVDFLRQAQRDHPADFWVNQDLGRTLRNVKSARAGEAVGYLRAALVLRPDSPGALVNLGIALYYDRDLPGALAAFQKAVALKRDYAAAHSNLGMALHAWGDLPGALAAYKQAIALKPDFATPYSGLGTALCDQGALPSAIAAFEKAIALESGFAKAHNNLGNALRLWGDLPGAIAVFEKAIVLKPDLAEAHGNLGLALNDMRKWDEAIVAFREAIQLKNDIAMAHGGLGLALKAKGQLDEAILVYRQAILIMRDVPELHYSLGLDLHGKGQLDEAIVECREAIRLKNDFAEAYNVLGNALKAKGLVDKAIPEYRKAIEIKKDLAEAHYNLGLALKAMGLLVEAIVEHREAVRLKPGDAETIVALGNALQANSQLDEAIAEYRLAIHLKMDYATAHNNLGAALHAKGRPDEAIDAFREAIRLKSDYPEAHNNLGATLAATGQLDAAIAAYRTAIDLKKDYPNAHFGLGTALKQKGQFREALEALRRGHELSSKTPGWPNPSAEWLRQCERLIELDGKLPGILRGDTRPASPAECIELADLCSHKRLHRAEAGFYKEAFDAQPKLVDDLDAEHRYNAACAAALAGCGKGQDAAQVDDTKRARLRRQALDWLRADLQAWGRRLDREPDKVPKVVEQMHHWLTDTDTAGVRGAEALARLPEAEREPWQTLWSDIANTLARAQAKKPQTKSDSK
jgi:tetratricopeptide (TPR) repeat protein/serine/threonine protein kinase